MKTLVLEKDKIRYTGTNPPMFQKYYRKTQNTNNPMLKAIYKTLFRITRNMRGIEISDKTEIGPGLYIGHAFGITINEKSKLGANINIHKGVTIGQENRGIRKGVPSIGNRVWIGINSTIVGKITIGDDVMIAPDTFINCDVPSHSVVFGNPCVIKHKENATEGYINNIVVEDE